MKRVRGKTAAPNPAEEKREDAPACPDPEQDTIWDFLKKAGGWLGYKLSMYLPIGSCAVHKKICAGKKIKAVEKLDLKKISGEIGELELIGIREVKGTRRNCSITKISVKDTDVGDILWDLIRMCRIVRLENVNLRTYRKEYLDKAVSIDILGSTAGQIKHCLVDLLDTKRKRLRVEDAGLLVYWNEHRHCTLAVRYANVFGVMRRLSQIEVLYFDNIEVTQNIVREMSHHPIKYVTFFKCYVLPLKIYDLVSGCRKTLRHITFSDTLITPGVAEHLKSCSIQVDICSTKKTR